MGWNPQFNFKLRDDQVAFGNLILDKNGAQFIAEMLIEIKNGAVPDLGLMKSVLDDYCFTDEEFDHLREEMIEIQDDIKEFKQIGSNTLQRWNVFMQTVAVHTNYVVGSDTWIEKYKELKMIAANMFDGILKCGYKFEESRLSQLHQRYDEIIGCTNGMERVGNFLQKQYKEALLNGDENALDNYCKGMVETGVWTQEVAEREKRKHRANNLLNEAEGRKDYEGKLKKSATEEGMITITWDMWKSMCDRVDDFDKDTVSTDDLQLAENILNTLTDRFSEAGNIPIDTMKNAHRSSQLINLGIATVNTAKLQMKKSDYEFIMNIKIHSEAVTTNYRNDYEQLTQKTIVDMISTIDSYSGLESGANYKQAMDILGDVFNEVNKECEVLDIAKNYSASSDFMVLMRTAVAQPSVGPMIDGVCIMYPASKLEKFYNLCSKVGESGNDAIKLSTEQSMLLHQTSGNIDVAAVCAIIEDGKFMINTDSIKMVYERINNYISSGNKCTLELFNNVHKIIKKCSTENPLIVQALCLFEDAMQGEHSKLPAATLTVLECIISDNNNPNMSVDVSVWNTILKETYIKQNGFVECYDFRTICNTMDPKCSTNYTWICNMQKALFAYMNGIEQYVHNNHSEIIQNVFTKIGELLENKEVSFEADKNNLDSIVSELERLGEVRHIKISIDTDVYETIFWYLAKDTRNDNKGESTNNTGVVPITQGVIYTLIDMLPGNIDDIYVKNFVEILTVYLNGIRNWAPDSSIYEINELLHQIENLKAKNISVLQNPKDMLTELLGMLRDIDNIGAINVSIKESLFNSLFRNN